MLHSKFRYYVPIKEIGYESIYFYKDEFDERIVPNEIVDYLEGMIQIETAAYTDEFGLEYMVIQVETDAPIPYEVWLVNGEVVPDFTILEDNQS